MARRNYLPPETLDRRDGDPSLSRSQHRPPLIDDRRDPHLVGPALMEERLASQHHEIQSLLVDNQRLAAAHVALKRELAMAQQELRHLSSTASVVKAEKDAQVREVYERSLKVEAEFRSIEGMGAELSRVKADIQELSSEKKELTDKLQAINNDLLKARSELKQFPAIEAEIKAIHQEISRGRAAVEYEKKVHANNLEQGQIMEKHMISMSREIEKLHAELANAEKRARAAAAATANPGYVNPEMSHGVNQYPDAYAMYQGGAGAAGHYGPGAVPQGHYDMQWNHAQR